MTGMSFWVAATRRAEQEWRSLNDLLLPEQFWRVTDKLLLDGGRTYRLAYGFMPDNREFQGQAYPAWRIIREVETKLANRGVYPGVWQSGHRLQSPNWEWMILGATDQLDEIPYGMTISDWIQMTNSGLENDPYSRGVYGDRDATYQQGEELPEEEKLADGYMFEWLVEFFKEFSAFNAKWPDAINPGNGREVWPPGYNWRTIPPQALGSLESGNPPEGGPLG